MVALLLAGCGGAELMERRAPGFQANALRRGSIVVLPMSVAETEIEVPWSTREEATASACAELKKRRRDLKVVCYSEYENTPALPLLDALVTDVAAHGQPTGAVVARARAATGAAHFLIFFPEAEVVKVEQTQEVAPSGGAVQYQPGGNASWSSAQTQVRSAGNALGALLANAIAGGHTGRRVAGRMELSYSLWASLIDAGHASPIWAAKRLAPVLSGRRAELDKTSPTVVEPWVSATTELSLNLPR